MPAYLPLPYLMLLLAVGLCHHQTNADLTGLPENQSSWLQGQWLSSSMNSKLKGEGAPLPHPIQGTVTQLLLYCHVGIGYHLQILPNGIVGGIHEPNEHSLLKVFSMKHGVVGIKGIKSGFYLCMTQEGITHGTKEFSSDCLFKETLEENHYTTYSSQSHPGIYLALSNKGLARRGNSVSRNQPCTHFLPRKGT